MSPMERALAESTERYRSLFDYNPHAAFSLDPLGQFTDANVVALHLGGYDMQELVTMSFADLICSEHLPRAHAAFAGALNRQPQQFEVSMWHKDGHVVEINLTAVPVVVNDQVVGVHGIAEDVTERNDLRRELERTRQLAQEASAAKSLFLANMSHEVRTPLTSVLAAAELLAEDRLGAGQERLLRVIQRAGQRLLRLVSDILDFSRIEAGKIELREDDFDLRLLLAEILEWATPLAHEQGLELRADLDAALPPSLRGDPLRVSQVLTNLLGNALKFTENGHVHLSVELTGLTGDDAQVRFAVADSGCGIPTEDMARLFRSFTQADPSTTRRHDGAGLGLAICQELVTLMDGTIEATSALGRGSTFTVVLPLALPRG